MSVKTRIWRIFNILQIHVFLYTVLLLKTTNKDEIQLVNINFEPHVKYVYRVICMYDIKCKGVNVFIYWVYLCVTNAFDLGPKFIWKGWGVMNISVIKYMSNLLYNNKISTYIVLMHILTFYFLYIFIKKKWGVNFQWWLVLCAKGY